MDPVIIEEGGSSFLDWATAVGTVGAVLTALYVGVGRAYRRQPKLSLIFYPDTSDTIVVRAVELMPDTLTGGRTPQVMDDYESAYLRLRVRNKAGRDTAEDVEVTITDAHERGVSNQIVRLDGLPLRYSNSAPPATSKRVAPGSDRHVDLAHIDFSGRPMDRPVWIDIHPRPLDSKLSSIGEGSLDLELTVTARNLDSVRYNATLRFTGQPPGDWGRLRLEGDASGVWDRLRLEGLRKVS